jgi:tetratricopeptide (TPR) repeat protein
VTHPARSRRKTAAVAALSIAVAVGALRYGGVEPLVAGGVTFAALAAAALALPRRRSREPNGAGAERGPEGLSLLPLGLALGAVVVALQLVPLPPGLLRFLSPNAAALFEETLAPVGRWPAWRPLSLAPGETGFLLAVAVAVAAAAAAASFLGESRRRGELLLKAICFTGLATSVGGMVAALFGLGPLLAPRLTFVNPNHLAGFLVLAAWPAFGFALRARGRERVGWLAAFVFTSVGAFLSLSRGGISAFFAAAAVSSVLAVLHGHTPFTVALLPGLRRKSGAGAAIPPTRRGRILSLVIPIGVAGALAVAAWLALEPIVAELETLRTASSDVKLSFWPQAVRLIGKFPVAGIGRGAYATFYPALKTEPGQYTFTHIENTWLQLPVDVGVLAGLGLLALFVWAWLAAARSRDLSRPMIGALAGAAGVAAQNLVDFSFELVGVALPFAIVLGLASRSMPRVRLSRPAGFASLTLLSVLAGAGLALHARRVGDDVAGRVATSASTEDAVDAATRALLWRPADWLPPAAAGVRIVAAGKCSEGLPWLVRAMRRNPTAPEPHRYAGRCLAASGQSALAKREFRLAFLYGDTSVLYEAHRRFPEPGELLDVAPETASGLMAAAQLLADSPEEAREAWRRAWEGFLDPWALAGLARVTLQLGEKDEALKLAQELERVAPLNPMGYVTAALAYEALEDDGAALLELEKGAARLPGRGAVLIPLGVRHLAAKRPTQARAIFEAIVAREGPELAQKKLLLARTFGDQGRMAEALTLAQDAAAINRESGSALEILSAYAAAAGRYDLAIDALERAGRLPTSEPGKYDERLAKLKVEQLEQARHLMERGR